MKNWLFKKFVDFQGSKYIRHAIAAFGAWMVTKGFDGDVENLVDLLTGITTILLVALWSMLAKAPPTAHWKAVIVTAAGALARQLQTALGTVLVMKPDDIATVSTSGLVMIGLNILISRLDASDNKPIQLNPDGSRP